jgi:intracellular sulfur oxidation DsrE/DsrF family protein
MLLYRAIKGNGMIKKIYARNVLLALLLGASSLMAAQKAELNEKYQHHVVVQIDSKNPQIRKMSLNNVDALINYFGKENIEVEVVIYGNKTGIDMAFEGSLLSERIKKMSQRPNVRFSACGNSQKKYEKRTGKKAHFMKEVTIVTAGVGRIIELQEEGYTYLHP